MSDSNATKSGNKRSRQAVMGDFFPKAEKHSKKTVAASTESSSVKKPRLTLVVETSGSNSCSKTVPSNKKDKPSEKTQLPLVKVPVSKKGQPKEQTGNSGNTTVSVIIEKQDKGKQSEKPSDTGKKSQKEEEVKEKGKSTEINKRPKGKAKGAGMFWSYGADRDTEEYRKGYPGKKDHPDWDDNYRFYMNQIPSKPDGDFIDKIHVDWWGDYKLLEVHHGYIQWLFPIRESGLNWHAQELQLHEIEKLQKSRKAMKRILTSYKMMLDFYGMKLVSEDDGTIERGDNWEERFKHLNRSFHNYLRITRILKCLGEFGYEKLKKNFIKFVLTEGLIEGTLTNVIDSCYKYWIGVLKNEEERREMYEYYFTLSEADNCALKRRSRSPSPKRSSWRNSLDKSEEEKAENDKNEVVNNESSNDKFHNFEKESPDDSEDDMLYYAMNLIDEDMEGNAGINRENTRKVRKTHEMSESEGEQDSSKGSQEMEHWNNEAKKTKEAELASGSEDIDEHDGSDKGNKTEGVAKKDVLYELEKEKGSRNEHENNKGENFQNNEAAGTANGTEKTGVESEGDNVNANNASKENTGEIDKAIKVNINEDNDENSKKSSTERSLNQGDVVKRSPDEETTEERLPIVAENERHADVSNWVTDDQCTTENTINSGENDDEAEKQNCVVTSGEKTDINLNDESASDVSNQVAVDKCTSEYTNYSGENKNETEKQTCVVTSMEKTEIKLNDENNPDIDKSKMHEVNFGLPVAEATDDISTEVTSDIGQSKSEVKTGDDTLVADAVSTEVSSKISQSKSEEKIGDDIQECMETNDATDTNKGLEKEDTQPMEVEENPEDVLNETDEMEN